MPAYTLKRKTRRTSKAPAKKRSRSSIPRALGDQTRCYVSSYFEVDAAQPDTDAAQGGVFGYSIKCDPMDATVTTDKSTTNTGVVAVSLKGADNAPLASGSALTIQRLAHLKLMYRQYRVDSVSVKVTTDRSCGLDNPLLALNDKGAPGCVTLVGNAMAQAHKSKVLTESNRTMSYGWKPKSSQERDFHMVGDKINNDNAQYIKFLQEIEPHKNTTCKHRIELSFALTLKDSQMGVAAGN